MNREARIALVASFALAAPLLFSLHACRGSASRRAQLASENPLDRAEAIVQAGESGDLTAVHQLVELLDDTNPAVRMYALHALRRLCGQDFGYRYYDNEAARAIAVQRWREAVRIGLVVLPTPADAEGDAPDASAQAPVRDTQTP